MKKNIVSRIVLSLLSTSILTMVFNIIPVKAQPFVKVYVDQPLGYIPSESPGTKFSFYINIETSGFADGTTAGIIMWKMDIRVNPDVLDINTTVIPSWPPQYAAKFSTGPGHFLYEFAVNMMGYPAPSLFLGKNDPLTGYQDEIAETGIPSYATGAGDYVSGLYPTLLTVEITSKSDTLPCLIELIDAMYRTGDGLWHLVDEVIDGRYNMPPEAVPAIVDVDADTLNLHSRGQWITAYIQLPEDYNAGDIDATTILLNETLQPVLDPKYDFVTNSSEYLADHNGDGILERMVKFNRTEVVSWIRDDHGILYGDVTLTITGDLYDGTPFEGTDTIKVLLPGDADDDGDVDSNDLYTLSRCHGMSIEDLGYIPLADFNEDGYINSDDLLILSENYGKTAVS